MSIAPFACLLLLAPAAFAAQDSAADAASTPALPSSTATPDQARIDEAVAIAVALLVGNQEQYVADPSVGTLAEERLASWQEEERNRLDRLRTQVKGAGREWPYEGVYRVGRDRAIPSGYRVGGTAIVCEALLEAPGFEGDEGRQATISRAVDFILDSVENDPQMAPKKQSRYDVRGWGHAYALSFLLRGLELEVLDDTQAEKANEQIPHLIHCLVANETKQGGWNYANDSSVSPFMTGSTLLALYRARDHGYEVPGALVTKALDALVQCREEKTGAFGYSGRSGDAMHASSARASAAELALLRAGRSSTKELRRSIAGFFDGWDELAKRKSQQGTHKGDYSIAPYYFFFGHTYAALAIEYLPEAERNEWRARMQEIVWRTREEHGGWNDRVFPRTESYSTAMCVLALIAPQLPVVPMWEAK